MDTPENIAIKPESYRIYLVDDDDNVRKSLSRVFESAGFEVIACSSGEEFLKILQPSLNTGVLLDMRMPGLSGLELLRKLNKQELIPPVIIYTAYADVDATVEAFSEGAFTVIQKPTSNNLLIDKVKSAIAKSKNNQSLKKLQYTARERLRALTKREYEIALLLAQGMSAPDIAKSIHISARTVETHRRNIFLNLQIKSVAELSRINTLAELTL